MLRFTSSVVLASQTITMVNIPMMVTKQSHSTLPITATTISVVQLYLANPDTADAAFLDIIPGSRVREHSYESPKP